MTDETIRSNERPDATRAETTAAFSPLERRNQAAREALRRRIQHEFAELPGLSLTLTQASRLFGVRSDTCARILSELA